MAAPLQGKVAPETLGRFEVKATIIFVEIIIGL